MRREQLVRVAPLQDARAAGEQGVQAEEGDRERGRRVSPGTQRDQGQHHQPERPDDHLAPADALQQPHGGQAADGEDEVDQRGAQVGQIARAQAERAEQPGAEGLQGEQRDDRAGEEGDNERHPAQVNPVEEFGDAAAGRAVRGGVVQVGLLDRLIQRVLDDLAGLFGAARVDQPPGGLGGAEPQQEDHGGQDGRAAQHPAPAGVAQRRGDQVADEVGQGGPDVPDDDDRGEDPASLPARQPLRQQRRGDRVVGGDRRPDDEPQDDQLPRGRHEHRQHRPGDQREQVEGVHRFTADPVGHRAEDQAAEEHPDQRGHADQGRRRRAQVPLGGDAGQRDPDDAQQVAVQQRAAAAGRGQLEVEPADRRFIDSGKGHPSLVPTTSQDTRRGGD
jgi:hypothetical protein